MQNPARSDLCIMMRSLLCILLTGLSADLRCRAQSNDGAIIDEFARTSEALTPLIDRDGGSSDPNAVLLVNHKWALAQQWILNYLNEHQWEGTVDLKPALRRLSPEFSDNVVRSAALDDHTYLIWPGSNYFGSVFIAQKVSGRYKVVWNIPVTLKLSPARLHQLFPNDHSSYSPGGNRGYLSPWTAEDELQEGLQRPISIGRLSDTATGDHRFFLNSYVPQFAGIMSQIQLTVWQWHAGAASPVFVNNHYDNECAPAPYFDGHYLHIPELGSPSSDEAPILGHNNPFCGEEVDRKVRIGGNNVEAAGETSLTPEYEFIDMLLAKIARKKDTRGVASWRVVAHIRPLISRPYIGVSDWAFQRGGNTVTACADLDFSGGIGGGGGDQERTLIFTLLSTGGRYYAKSVEDAADNGCRNYQTAQ